VPAVLNVNEKLEPTAITPLFQMLEFDVVVCAVSSLFTQVTVVPTFTIIGCTVPNSEF
jgi:hypothetical protein